MEKHYEITPRTVLFTLIVLIGLWALIQIRLVVVALFVALILSLALDPLVEKLKGWRLPRPLGVFLVFFVFLAVVGGLSAYGFTPLVTQTGKFIVNLPEFLSPILDRLGPTPLAAELQQQLVVQATLLSANILAIAGAVVSNVFSLLMILILTFYFLLDWENLRKRFIKALHKDSRGRMQKIINSIEKRLGGWLRGQLILMILVGVLVYLGLFALGVEYALPLAVIAGLFEVVPVIGPIVSGIPALVVGFGTSFWLGVWILVLYVIVQQLENSVIVPHVMGRTAGLSPLTTLVILFVGGSLFGIGGVVLAIPATIMLSILARDLLDWDHIKKSVRKDR